MRYLRKIKHKKNCLVKELNYYIVQKHLIYTCWMTDQERNSKSISSIFDALYFDAATFWHQ